jgi:uncharacterized membrane protein YgcG
VNASMPLDDLLAAWRDDAWWEPNPEARERARAAMHLALGSRSRRPLSAWAGLRLRPRRLVRRHPLLTGLAGAVAAVVVVAAVGWNAPPGSPLYGVRAARQSVQLALPGADTAALHLQFAEADLTDAQAGLDPASSLADARAELAAALPALPADHGSPLWGRYNQDQALLAAESGDSPTRPAAPTLEPSESQPPGTSSPGEGEGSPRPGASAEPSDSGGSGTPTAGGGTGGGDDGGGSGGGGGGGDT